MKFLPYALVAALAITPALAQKKVITSADQMPRREYAIPKLPSELRTAPRAELDAVVAAVDKDLATDLETLDIQDRATRTSLLNARAQFAVHRGDYKAAQGFVREVRAQQDKAADKLLSGVTLESMLEGRLQGGTPEAQRARGVAMATEQWNKMPWDVVGTNLKSSKSALELLSRDVVIGAIKTSMDPAAKNLNLKVPGSIVTSIVAVRNNFDVLLPARDDLVASLQKLVDKNQVARADVWSDRLAVLPSDGRGKPVVVGIWDSGTDVALFRAAKIPGIAFDKDMRETKALVRPMGEAESRLPVLKQYVKGSMDMQAAIDSPDARALKQRVSSLKQDEVKQFMEDLAAVGMWVHGTHVAGIAVEGNPYAQVTAVAMHFNHSSVPDLPTEERSHRAAAAFKKAVEHFRQTGTRVVNMSWRYGPTFHEGALAYHNVGKTPEERKQMSLRLFEIEKRALEGAIAGAPEILFVAGSGNEDNSADFSQYIPAGLTLPNLITAGAVDQSGVETAFSTFGKTVVVHANGFEVVSLAPGGEKLKLSGTSMASPQVANLAAKIFALKPELTPVQVKELILKGAEKNGRVNLINPKKTLGIMG